MMPIPFRFKSFPQGGTAVAAAYLAIAASALGIEPLEIRTVDFDSEAVGRRMRYNIVLPEGYEDSEARYPVLYLLHGLTSDYTAWARLGIQWHAIPYDLIVVMPDGGNSWYVNWERSDGGQENRWEDYIVRDLIGHVDANWRTTARREGRAINGFSMGGYGAVMLALRNPDLFCSAGSHSGALRFAENIAYAIRRGEEVDIREGRNLSDEPREEIGIEGFSSQAERYPAGRIFVTADHALACDPFALVQELEPEDVPHLYIDCGTEDGLLNTSRSFVNVLMARKLPFTFSQADGGHRADYWAAEVEQSLAVQARIIRRALNDALRDEGADKPEAE